jgi:hypothetical protein
MGKTELQGNNSKGITEVKGNNSRGMAELKWNNAMELHEYERTYFVRGICSQPPTNITNTFPGGFSVKSATRKNEHSSYGVVRSNSRAECSAYRYNVPTCTPYICSTVNHLNYLLQPRNVQQIFYAMQDRIRCRSSRT